MRWSSRSLATSGRDTAARPAYRRRDPAVVRQFLFGRPTTRETILSSGYLPPARQQHTFLVRHPSVRRSRAVEARPMAGSMGAAGTEEGRHSGRDRISQRSLRRRRRRTAGLRETVLPAPYSQECDCHWYTHLTYPRAAAPKFLQEFQTTVESFENFRPRSREE